MGEQATVWRMHAHDRHGTFYDLGPRPWVELHGLNFPIVAVEVRLVADDAPTATCFPYGPRAEEESGRGRTVCLAVTRTEQD